MKKEDKQLAIGIGVVTAFFILMGAGIYIVSLSLPPTGPVQGSVQAVNATPSTACVWEFVKICYHYDYSNSSLVTFKLTGNQTLNGQYYVLTNLVCVPWEMCDGMVDYYPIQITNNTFTMDFNSKALAYGGNALSVSGPAAKTNAMPLNYNGIDVWVNSRPGTGIFGIPYLLFVVLVVLGAGGILAAIFLFLEYAPDDGGLNKEQPKNNQT